MGHFHSYVKFLAREREREGRYREIERNRDREIERKRDGEIEGEREGERERESHNVIVYHTLVGLTVR